MYIEQLYTSCLSQFAYYIESDGVAAVIDPMRDVEPYLELAGKRGAVIKYVFESHFHADFVSGHLDLAAKTGAAVVFGPDAKAAYEIHSAFDGEEFVLGSVTLKVLHTPGHTLESVCILLLDERHNPHSVFTGDTLFVGDVGRPDLAVNSSYSREHLAGMLYTSVFSKLLPLPNYVIVYPGHGAGSACGKAIGKELHTSIGEQKKNNYALKTGNQSDFIRLVTEGLQSPPQFFQRNVAINQNGYKPLEKLLEHNVKPLAPDEVKVLVNEKKALILDAREALEFGDNFIPGAVNIGLNGPFAFTAGSILDPDVPVIIVAEAGQEKEVAVRLARVGLEKVEGFLDGGYSKWMEAGNKMDTIKSIGAEEFADLFRYNSCYAIDVRSPDQWIPGFVSGAKLIALPDLENKMAEMDSGKTCYVYCEKGYRSMIACSLLRKHGFSKVVNVEGGMNKIRKTTLSIRQLSSIAS